MQQEDMVQAMKHRACHRVVTKVSQLSFRYQFDTEPKHRGIINRETAANSRRSPALVSCRSRLTATDLTQGVN